MYDAIVIGSGLGGLTAGAKLAKEGRKILLIEQHSLLGGYASSFRRKGSRMEVALHELDGLHEDDPKRRIFEELGVMDGVTFLPLPSFYRFIWRDKDFIVPHDIEGAITVLEENFPGQGEAIRGYFQQLPEISRKFRGLAREPNSNEPVTVGEFMDQLTDDEGLKLALSANVGYYHDDPYDLNLFIYAAGQTSFYSGGGYFIKGGSQSLSNYLGDFIRHHGGKIVTNHRVTRIIVEDGQAKGVQYCRANRDDGKIQEARGQTVVANASVPAVMDKLLPPGAAPELDGQFGNWRHSTSATSLYLFFKHPPVDLGNPTYSTFLFDDEVETIKDFAAAAYHSNFAKRSLIFTDYSQVDSALAKPGKGVGSMCVLDRLADWEGLGEDDYLSQKSRVTEAMLSRLERFAPGILNEVEHTELATPRTIVQYTGNPSGAIYGFAQSVEQSLPNRPAFLSPVPGLYFASAWSRPGGGFTGAILSGYGCAREVLKGEEVVPS